MKAGQDVQHHHDTGFGPVLLRLETHEHGTTRGIIFHKPSLQSPLSVGLARKSSDVSFALKAAVPHPGFVCEHDALPEVCLLANVCFNGDIPYWRAKAVKFFHGVILLNSCPQVSEVCFLAGGAATSSYISCYVKKLIKMA